MSIFNDKLYKKCFYDFINKLFKNKISGSYIHNRIYYSKFFNLTLMSDNIFEKKDNFPCKFFAGRLDYFRSNYNFKNYENYYTDNFKTHCAKMELERNLKQINQNQNNNKKVVKI